MLQQPLRERLCLNVSVSAQPTCYHNIKYEPLWDPFSGEVRQLLNEDRISKCCMSTTAKHWQSGTHSRVCDGLAFRRE